MRPSRGILAALLLIPGLAAGSGVSPPEHLLAAFAERHPGLAETASTPTIDPAPPQVIHHGNRDQDRVALTFDACSDHQHNEVDDRILEILREQEIPATLFLGGRWMAEHADLTRELHDDPLFEIGTHAWGHPDLTEQSPQEVEREIGLAQMVAHALTGEWPRHFRAPYVAIDETVWHTAGALGVRTVQHDVASGDADPEAEPERVAEHVLDRVAGGSIVVLHLHDPELPTAAALPAILDGLRERDLEPVRMDRLHAPE